MKDTPEKLRASPRPQNYRKRKGFEVAAGHGLTHHNLPILVSEVPEIVEYNIGHSIVGPVPSLLVLIKLIAGILANYPFMISLYSVTQDSYMGSRPHRFCGFPSHTLMELAGREVAVHIHKNHRDASNQCLWFGKQRWDGYVIARWLSLWGHVEVVSVSEPQTEDAKKNMRLCPIQSRTLNQSTKKSTPSSWMHCWGRGNLEPQLRLCKSMCLHESCI